MVFDTLDQATTLFRLRDPNMNNDAIAQKLGAHSGVGDYQGSPACCFFKSGGIAAIRTKKNEIVVFHVFQSVRMMAAEIADKIVTAEEEAERTYL